MIKIVCGFWFFSLAHFESLINSQKEDQKPGQWLITVLLQHEVMDLLCL